MNPNSYLILRFAVGMSMFGHGLVRLPRLAAFSQWMVTGFEKSILPRAVVVPFSFLLPCAEFTIGILLLLGLFTRQALIAGGVVMALLILGSTTIEDWNAIPSQLIHALFFAILLHYASSNKYSLDGIMRK